MEGNPMRNAFPVFLLAALLAAPAPAETPAQKGSTKLQVKPGPPQIGGSNVPPVDPDKNKLVPAVQKAGMTGMEGMGGMAGMGGSNLPAVQLPNLGPPNIGDSNLPAVQAPGIAPAGGFPGGMGATGFQR
jgi:hypothetical protein